MTEARVSDEGTDLVRAAELAHGPVGRCEPRVFHVENYSVDWPRALPRQQLLFEDIVVQSLLYLAFQAGPVSSQIFGVARGLAHLQSLARLAPEAQQRVYCLFRESIRVDVVKPF